MGAIVHPYLQTHIQPTHPIVLAGSWMGATNREDMVPLGGFFTYTENRQSIANEGLGLVCRLRQKIDKVLVCVFH